MKPKRVVVIGADHPKLEKFCPNWRGMKAGLSRLPLEWKFVSCRPRLHIGEIVEFEPDLIVYGLIDMIKRASWRNEIRQKCPNAKIVMWYGDYRDKRTEQIRVDCSDTVDAMFVSNDAQEDFYKLMWKMPRVYFLPLGCEPMEKPRINSKYAFDFVFIGGQITGGAFKERADFIETLRREHGLTIVNSFEPDMRAKIFELIPEIYASSKISLDVSHFVDVPRYTSIRYWEIPAFWGFALTKRFPYCEEFYSEEERVYFDTIEEMIVKRDYFLKHEDERIKMVKRAHKRSYEHTYDKRFTRMFSLL